MKVETNTGPIIQIRMYGYAMGYVAGTLTRMERKLLQVILPKHKI